MKNRITKDEVNQLYEEWHTPDKVKAHCKAVSDVGVKLAEELNKHGYKLDIDLIRGSGLAHDVARTSEKHAEVGYKILSDMGYYDEADIVRVHMTYPQYNSVEKLNECDIMCIADRVVKEDRYVGLDERMEYIINKIPQGNPEVVKKILSKKAETKVLLDDIAKVIGKTLDQLFLDK